MVKFSFVSNILTCINASDPKFKNKNDLHPSFSSFYKLKIVCCCLLKSMLKAVIETF